MKNGQGNHIVTRYSVVFYLHEKGEESMKQKVDIIVVGFALFSIFFGASNLIFPPFIGVTSGSEWLTSFLGFILGDVGIILLSIYAVAKAGSYQAIMGRAGKGMETGLFSYFAHPDLFMRSWTDLNEDFYYVCRKICEKAKELDILLEYNISGYIYNRDFNVNGFPNINFWTIAAEVGCKAIIGIDAHHNMYYETEEYRNRALKELADLNIEVVETMPFIQH